MSPLATNKIRQVEHAIHVTAPKPYFFTLLKDNEL